MRLLLVAPTADAQAVGESELAYQWVHRLAQRHDVTVLSYYQRRGRPLTDQLPGARVVEWREPPLIGRHERFNAMVNPGYVPFYRRARRWLQAAIARGERFDIGHQLTPVSVRYPTPLAGFDVPYVLGPVGGSLESPPGFEGEEKGAPWFTGLRALDGFRLRHDPLLRRSFERAACVLGIADYVRALLGEIELQRFVTMHDVGIARMPAPAPGSRRTADVRLLFVGRVVRTKGVRDAIRALSHLPRGLATLDVVGEGYDRAACEALATELAIADRVEFHGHVPHARVSEFYTDADIFVFPSYREAGGIVVIEAMSFGLPVIVCDAGGPATAVDDASGLRVPATDPAQYAAALARAIESLATDPERRIEMGRAGRARVEATALWDNRIETLEAIYAEVLRRS